MSERVGAEQTPDIEAVLAEAWIEQAVADEMPPDTHDAEWRAANAAAVIRQALAAAVREASPSARSIYEAIDWDFVEVFPGEDEPGYPTPEAFCEHLANSLSGAKEDR